MSPSWGFGLDRRGDRPPTQRNERSSVLELNGALLPGAYVGSAATSRKSRPCTKPFLGRRAHAASGGANTLRIPPGVSVLTITRRMLASSGCNEVVEVPKIVIPANRTILRYTVNLKVRHQLTPPSRKLCRRTTTSIGERRAATVDHYRSRRCTMPPGSPTSQAGNIGACCGLTLSPSDRFSLRRAGGQGRTRAGTPSPTRNRRYATAAQPMTPSTP
jgi:hypothetical protein